MQAVVRRFDPAAEYWFREGCWIAEWSNADDDPAVSIARARVAPGAVTCWHRLLGSTERYVILSGHGRVEVGDLPPQEVGPRDVVLIPPGVRQRIAAVGQAELAFLAVCTPRFRPETYEDLESP
ncbi:MAG: cupin domain-containing protein [Pseudomonadota bacterium]|jgi:mannose-6-phosphate isomerase-like protein (cupin superfamily)